MGAQTGDAGYPPCGGVRGGNSHFPPLGAAGVVTWYNSRGLSHNVNPPHVVGVGGSKPRATLAAHADLLPPRCLLRLPLFTRPPVCSSNPFKRGGKKRARGEKRGGRPPDTYSRFTFLVSGRQAVADAGGLAYFAGSPALRGSSPPSCANTPPALRVAEGLGAGASQGLAR